MRAVKVFSLIFLVCAGLFLYPDGAGPASLIKIPKGAGLPGPFLSRLPVVVRQELETCLLALADGKSMALLRRNGVRFTILERNANKKEFVLVPIAAPGTLDSLRSRGKAVAVEPGTAVFWTESGRAAEAVPAGLPRKVLSSRPVRVDFKPIAAAGAPELRAAAADPLVEAIVALVSSSNLSSDVQSLQDFQTRYASTTNCEAAGEYLYGAFSALGLDVRFETFAFSGYTSRNVIAEKTGETFPDDVVVICAHYDSTSPSRETLAPGADDNASGVAAVLEAARVLAAYTFDFTVRFAAFSAEEWGLFGSRYHAAHQAGKRIVGVINLDMIGYADAMPEDVQIIVNSRSGWLADRFLAAASDYGSLNATKTVDASFVYSDHSPFWDNGYSALVATEDDPLTNPYYHQVSDTLGTLNPDFFTSGTRASVGLLAELAQPIKEGHPQTPVELFGLWDIYRSLFNTLSVVHVSWIGQADAAGYNVYRTSTPHFGYVKINDTPVTGTHFRDEDVSAGGTYYYVITAVGPTGLESNRSREMVPADLSVWESPSVRSLGSQAFKGIR